ncbi:MAG: deoxyuridine 5'-triphosphate nucleotidohydrolase [Bacilli bacterium]|nr:deoxyuridine 5'-triphosphate nucleotidohydrolase [Bacilli bacterium]
MRYFEKINFEQFKKDISNDKKLYNEYNLPKRQTKYSAGYDFESLFDFTLKPGETKKIATGIKVNMNSDEMLMIVIRSSLGFRYNTRMCNQVGIVESDYYNNPDNDGHLFVKIQNEGTDDLIIKKGDRICQGIFVKFLTIDNEEEIKKERTSGIGSTN